MKKLTSIFDFFKWKVSNDLETNTSCAILSTANVEENLDVPIKENLDEPIEENLDILIKENSALLTPSPNSIHKNNHN